MNYSRRFAIGFLICLLSSLCFHASGAEETKDASLKKQLDALREKSKLVGAGALVMVDGKVIAIAASGERKLDSGVAVSINDKWHHGSITKSMTATIIGRLVERGELDWNDKLPELLPDLSGEFDDSWKNVTLHHLLTHTAGVRPNVPILVQTGAWPEGLEAVHQARRRSTLSTLKRPAKSPAGEKLVYSNVGYMIAGYIAAVKAETTWEDLIQKELFDPLKLESGGFGPPRGDKPLDQPWGHVKALSAKVAMDPANRADNAPVIGPAGIVHLTMQDLATYGWAHLGGETKEGGFLKPETFRKLHEPVIDNYGYGWVAVENDDLAGGRTVWHNGSNTMWYSLLILLPAKNAVLVFVSNDGDVDKAEAAFFALAKTIAADLPAQKKK